MATADAVAIATFLSTLSLRRATQAKQQYLAPRKFLSTLSLRRATKWLLWCRQALYISIHALLAESDPGENLVNGIRLIFLSTLSLRRATRGWTLNINGPMEISIHALLAESDSR